MRSVHGEDSDDDLDRYISNTKDTILALLHQREQSARLDEAKLIFKRVLDTGDTANIPIPSLVIANRINELQPPSNPQTKGKL